MATAPFKMKSPLEVRGHIGINVTPSDDYEILVNGTKGIVIPSGTTAQSPPHTSGLIRYNTDVKQYQVSRNSEWRDIAKLAAGSAAPLAGQPNDVYVLLDGTNTKVNDILMHNGTTFVSLMDAVKLRMSTIETSVSNLTAQVSDLDFGEY